MTIYIDKLETGEHVYACERAEFFIFAKKIYVISVSMRYCRMTLSFDKVKIMSPMICNTRDPWSCSGSNEYEFTS